MTLLIDSQYFAPITEFKNLSNGIEIFVSIEGLYQKHSFTNRILLAGSQGMLDLSIPIVGGRTKKQLLKEVRIDYSSKWNIKHWRTIESCYRRAPWYEFYETDLCNIYKKNFEYLWDWNLELLQWILNRIGFNCIVVPFWGIETFPIDLVDYTKTTNPRNYLQHWEKSDNKTYLQVFSETQGFLPNLSILDLLFNLGPSTFIYLNQVD